jgi:hypothetical protein
MRHMHKFFAAALVASLVALAGCSGRQPASDLVSVIGQITLDGQAPRAATVSFVPENEKLETVSASVSPKGMYSLATRDRVGVPPGRYKVVLETADGREYTTSVEVVKAANTRRYDLQLTTK